MKIKDITASASGLAHENVELRVRSVYDETLNADNIDLVVDVLSRPNNITKVFLECSLNADGVIKLAKVMQDNTKVTSFDLWNSGGMGESSNEVLAALNELVVKNTTITRLHLSGVSLASADTTEFFKHMQNNKNIEDLSLWETSFEDKVAPQIADLLKANTPLKALRLGGHWFNTEGLTLILNALPANTKLETIDLSDTWRSGEVAFLFAKVLEQNIHLKAIKLFNSKINAEGAVALANSLLKNIHLIKLDLGCNSIGNEGTLAFATALKTNNTLRKLKIGVYSANDEGLTAFAEMLQTNTALYKFDYNSSSTRGDAMDKLKIDIGLARNKLAYLKSKTASDTNAEKLKTAEAKLQQLTARYEKKQKLSAEANVFEETGLADLPLQFLAMFAGRRGCCAFPGMSADQFSAIEAAQKEYQEEVKKTENKP